MTTEIVGYRQTAAEVYDVGAVFDVSEFMSREMRRRLVVVAPSDQIWNEYAESIGWQAHNEFGGNFVIKHGEQLIGRDMPLAPFVLVIGMPLDTESRLSVMGAIGAMQASWEAQGGKVVYVQNYTPSALAMNKAGLEAKSHTREVRTAEYRREQDSGASKFRRR